MILMACNAQSSHVQLTLTAQPKLSTRLTTTFQTIRATNDLYNGDKVFKSYTGWSALEMGEITLTAPTKQQFLTPAEIGAELGLSAQHVNEILAGAGYQHKIAGMWEALPPGESYAVITDTGELA